MNNGLLQKKHSSQRGGGNTSRLELLSISQTLCLTKFNTQVQGHHDSVPPTTDQCPLVIQRRTPLRYRNFSSPSSAHKTFPFPALCVCFSFIPRRIQTTATTTHAGVIWVNCGQNCIIRTNLKGMPLCNPAKPIMQSYTIK